MGDVNLAVIYYSSTGNIHAMAKAAAEAAEEAGAEVRLRLVDELAPEEAIAKNEVWKAFHEAHENDPKATLDDLDWADAILLGSPTRYGNVAAQMKQFLDSSGPLWGQGKLASKVVSAFSSAGNPHGGQETTILALYTTMHHWGAITVPTGYTGEAVFRAGGNPYGTSATASESGPGEAVLEGMRHQARRVVTVARWLKAGRAASEEVRAARH